MNIILKTTLKNTFGKPLRSLLVIFSIFVCAFAALFCFDLANTEKELISYIYSEMSGDADFLVYAYRADTSLIPEDLPEHETLNIRYFTNMLYKDVPGEYSYVTIDTFSMYGFDPELGVKMGYLDKDDEIGFKEIIVTDTYADEYGVEVGDTITVYDNAGEKVDLTVTGIKKADLKSLVFRKYSGAVNNETADVLSCGKPVNGEFMINILDDSRLEEAEEILNAKFKSDNVERFAMTEDMEEMMNELFGFLFILFAVAFLLVIFITFSICERIVSERMSYIGTLRSLGMSPGGTARILLMENVCYALLGSIPGVLLYLGIRAPMMDSLLGVSENAEQSLAIEVPMISIGLIIGVVIIAIAIECLIPLKSVLRALKISIRDIIFDNRDTEYKFNKAGIITGCIMAVIAVITFIVQGGLFVAAVCLITSVMALAFLFPLILKAVTNGVFKLSEKFEKEKMSLAAREAISRKSTVGSGVLCATSVTMCVLVYIIATSMNDMMDTDAFKSDVIVTCTGQPKNYSFVEYLDGVTDVEYVYQATDYVYFGDETLERTVQVYGMPENGYELYDAFEGLPEEISDGDIYVEKQWLKRNGYSVGDTVTITFHPLAVFPVVREYTIAGTFKLDTYESMKNNFVMSKNDFITVFHNFPGYVLVNCSDPDKIKEDIENYAINKYSDVKTKQEMIDDYSDDAAQSSRIFKIVIAVAVIMTCIGMISNQLIGFEGRKKECAVMISTSMSRKTLAGVLFREMLITSVTASTFGVALASLLVIVIRNAMDYTESLVMPVELNPATVFTLWILMMAVFTLTVLFPLKTMRKMKLSEQLKYE